MDHLTTATPLLFAFALLLLGFLPRRTANAIPGKMARGVTVLIGLQALAAIGVCVLLAVGWGWHGHAILWRWSSSHVVSASVMMDGVSALMWTLVSCIGWVICRYSVRYLDGEREQGNYFRWTAFTIGAVSLMVVSGNLAMFLLAWVMTSTGLHHLLLHYADRPAAQRAAWTKFTISRLGDVALSTASVIAAIEFNTLEFDELFATAATQTGGWNSPVTWIGSLIVLGAATKSAQFPFHTWVPLTMETPTPVSALMHAGVVNAGGYLIIRMSPLVVQAPTAMAILAIVGGFTACFAGLIMLTQSSVKRSLAYSTIAQMGFMMLQCGLGAFSAAMLHILAHSIYKAHAFLSSGSVLSAPTAKLAPASTNRRPIAAAGLALVASVTAGVGLAVVVAAYGIDLSTKPGGWLLVGILWSALATWLWLIVSRSNRWGFAIGAAGVVAMAFSYITGFAVIDNVLQSASVASTDAPALHTTIVTSIVAIGWIAFCLLQIAIATKSNAAWLRAFHVHASNGFYVDAWVRRLLST